MADRQKFFRTHNATILILLSLFSSASGQAQTVGVFRDQGGAVFNVKAYGATGNGTTDDTPSIQAAINAAIAAQGGVVYLPAGTYLIGGTLTNGRGDIVSLVGAGMGSELKISSILGLSMPSTAGTITQFHAAGIEHLRFVCTNSSAGTAVKMTDMVAAPALFDLTVSSCNVAFDLVNTAYWTERLTAINITDNYNTHLFHYDQNPSDPNNSYGYGTYEGIYINKEAGQDVFYLTGGAYLYHSTFIIKGNFSPNSTVASIFHVEGSSGQPCPGASYNTYDIAVEGSSYSVVNAANNGCSGGATGNALVTGSGLISAIGALAGTNGLIRDANNIAYLAGTLTTTAATADTLSSPAPNPYSQCFVQPQNLIAAQYSYATYVSATNWGSVIVSHPAISGALFQVWCTQ